MKNVAASRVQFCSVQTCPGLNGPEDSEKRPFCCLFAALRDVRLPHAGRAAAPSLLDPIRPSRLSRGRKDARVRACPAAGCRGPADQPTEGPGDDAGRAAEERRSCSESTRPHPHPHTYTHTHTGFIDSERKAGPLLAAQKRLGRKGIRTASGRWASSCGGPAAALARRLPSVRTEARGTQAGDLGGRTGERAG